MLTLGPWNKHHAQATTDSSREAPSLFQHLRFKFICARRTQSPRAYRRRTTVRPSAARFRLSFPSTHYYYFSFTPVLWTCSRESGSADILRSFREFQVLRVPSYHRLCKTLRTGLQPVPTSVHKHGLERRASSQNCKLHAFVRATDVRIKIPNGRLVVMLGTLARACLICGDCHAV